jgi:hypothetical protein
MMATTLEISFLKLYDKNYFIYRFLCYNEIFCIFYRFYRINVRYVVLLVGSPCISIFRYSALCLLCAVQVSLH